MATAGTTCQTSGPTYYVNITGSGFTAVGPGAQANNFHPQPPVREDVHSHRHHVSTRHCTSPDKEQEYQTYDGTYTYDRIPRGRKSFKSEKNPGTYCLPKVNEAYYQQHYGSKWNPKPSESILCKQGTTDGTFSLESFLEDVDKSIIEFDNSGGPLKEQKEHFILVQILPYLELSWGKAASNKMDAYKILAKISNSRSGGKVVRHALQQLQYLLFRDDHDSCKENLLKVEKIMRSSITSPEAVFKEEADPLKEIRLSVYKRILSLIIIHQIQAGFSTADLKNDMKKLQEELKKYCNNINYKKKSYFRYSMEFIMEAISYLLKPCNKVAATSLGGCLDECQDLFEALNFDVMDLAFLQKLKKRSRVAMKKMKTGDWFDLHCILCYLHGKVHSERPTPQMQTERRAMILLRRVIEAYQEGGGGDDWRFCLLAASILSDVTMNNITKELRIEAGSCLVNLLKDEKLKKRPECRAILERMSSGVLFSPDPFTKMLFANHLLENHDLQDTLAEDLHIQHLTTRYRNQTLEVKKTTISQGLRYFVKRGMFQRKEAVVKTLYVTKQDILEGDTLAQSKTRDRLMKEAYNLNRLSELNHPHITVMLSYNTKTLPYHIITQYERYGNLLQFVQASREGNELLPIHLLLKMLLDVTEALLFLQHQGLVHRAVMAENILVGDDYVCKLSGMHSLRQLQNGPTDEVQGQEPMYDHCLSDDSCLEVICADDDDLPVRWKARECLMENRYSTASDVWAFGVLMYEVLTYGCRPYRNIPNDNDVINHVVRKKHVLSGESCFQHAEYDIMKQCWEWQRRKRIKLADLKKKLEELHDLADNSEENPRADPPLLHANYNLVLQSDDGADDVPTRYMGQDGLSVKERITSEDKQHLKKLLSLDNPNLIKISIDNLDSHCPIIEMISTDAPLGNLKEYVLDRRCEKGDLVMFLSQVASALHYLHVKHIIHGDLRAEYVNVLAPDKVQVTRLGRSKSLSKMEHDVTTKSCVIQRSMPPDSIRWSSPEVILENNYSHASDVWAFGILAWELYTAFATGQEGRSYSVPYSNLVDDEILLRLREIGPLSKPDGCPDWMYIIMHQCWTYDPVQRPPFIAIFDCLTSRQPMRSWLMTLWLKRHDRREWPDLSISQPDNACHVSIKDDDRSVRSMEEMCSEGFFAEHDYRYVQSDGAERVPEDLYDDMSAKKYFQTCSDLQDEELYEDPRPTQQRGGGCYLANTKNLAGPNIFSTEPRQQNGHIDVTKTDLQGEELYDDIPCQYNDLGHVARSEKHADPKVLPAEPRYQNVWGDFAKSQVKEVYEGMTDADDYDDIADAEEIWEDECGIYEEIGDQSPDARHAPNTDEHPSNCSSDVETEQKIVDTADDELYEEIERLVISQPVQDVSIKTTGNEDSAEAVSCDEVITRPENGSITEERDENIDDEPVYDEIGGLQLAESIRGHQDTTGYKELTERTREYMPLKQAAFTTRNTSSVKKDAAKLNNRRRCHIIEDHGGSAFCDRSKTEK